jgi:RNA polymerase sigma-70 factor, ECF subfamily
VADEVSDAFLRLVRPQWKAMHRVAHRYVASGDDAHDLVQETLLRAWKGFSTADEREYSRAWLFVIMRSTVVDWHRAANRRVTFVPIPDAELTELAPADLSEPFAPFAIMTEERFREFLDDRVVAALDALDPAFREVVFLSVAGDLSYREIAEVHDCPVGTIMSRMARARRSLRERLAGMVEKRPPAVERER